MCLLHSRIDIGLSVHRKSKTARFRPVVFGVAARWVTFPQQSRRKLHPHQPKTDTGQPLARTDRQFQCPHRQDRCLQRLALVCVLAQPVCYRCSLGKSFGQVGPQANDRPRPVVHHVQQRGLWLFQLSGHGLPCPFVTGGFFG